MNQKTSKDDLNRDPAEPERKVGRPEDKPYSGVLAQPIVVDWKKENFAASLTVDLENKVAALFDHFQMEHRDYRKLAVALAFKHVPGFQFQKPAGARKRWSFHQQALLLLEVHRYQAGKRGSGASVTAACRRIAAAGLFGKVSAGTLERQYYATVKSDKF